ncbi:MAG: PQQ-binding-like beta-propeller repeat protein [bacterium]|nr:PQQ-binding-like beta-propeller repeat protein [bacterium]
MKLKNSIYVVCTIALLFGIASCDSPGPFEQKWQVDLEETGSIKITPFADKVVVVNKYHDLYLFDAETGDTVWQIEHPDSVYNSVGVYMDKLLVGDDKGKLTAYSVENGDVDWEMDITDGFYSRMFLKGDTLFVGAGKSVYSIDLLDRKTNWSTQLDDDDSIWVMPVVDGDIVYIQVEEHIYALDAENGEEIWTYETCSYSGGSYGEPVAVMQGKVLTGTPTKKFIALDKDDGKLLWEFDAAEGAWNDRMVVEPYTKSGKVIFGFDAIITLEETEEGPSSENVGRVICLATAIGMKLWQYDAPSFNDIAFSKNKIYLASGDTIHVINANSGRGKAVELPGEYSEGLTVDGKTAYFVMDDKYLVCGGM